MAVLREMPTIQYSAKKRF